MSGHEGSMAEFVNAYDCGHRTTVTRYGAAGLAWCWVCQRFVGVIVQAVNPPPAVSAVTQHGPQQ